MINKALKGLILLMLLSILSTSDDRLVRAQGGSGRPPLTVETPPPNKPVVIKRKTRPHVSREPRNTTAGRTPRIPSLWIVSKISEAKVFVDDELKGETDAKGEYELKLPPGTYMIRVTKDGYFPSLGSVDVEPGSDEREVEFLLSPALAALNVVTDPPEAEVYLDEVYKGVSNANGLLVIERISSSQPHTVRVRKDGYQQQAVPVTTYSGQLSVKLAPVSSKLKVVTEPAEAEIYLDDVYKGTSTAEGLLIIDQVNPNQTHSVRAKRDGFRQQSVSVAPQSSEAVIKLLPDPVVVLIKSIKQHMGQGQLVEAFEAYRNLTLEAADHQELPRLAETILQGLQARSTEMLKRGDAYGLPADLKGTDEMSKLYLQARTWRAGDETIETLAKYWTIESLLASAARSASVVERESLRRNAQSILSELSERNLRNNYLLLDLGWAWLKVNNSAAAEKYFNAALELKPDWAFPHFALGVIATTAGDREISKTPKTIRYRQAIESFNRAIALKQDFSRAYALRSLLYASLKQHQEAADSGLQAVTLAPNSAYAHYALGHAYFQKGGKAAFRNAREQFNLALSLEGELDALTRETIRERLTVIERAIK